MEIDDPIAGGVALPSKAADVTTAANPTDPNAAWSEMFQWATRVDLVTYIGVGPRSQGRLKDARILARLGLHLCFDAERYPFSLGEIQQLDDRRDLEVALAFIADQTGPSRSMWEPDELDDPNGPFRRLQRMAE